MIFASACAVDEDAKLNEAQLADAQLPRAESAIEEHAIAGHAEPSPESIEATLLTAKDGKSVDSVAVRIDNLSDSAREVWLEVVGVGLNGQNAERTFGRTMLDAAASTTVHIPVAELPLQSAMYPITTIVGVAYSAGHGGVRRMLLRDFTVRFEGDLQRAALAPNGGEQAFELPAGAQPSLVGRVFDADKRTFAALDNAALSVGASAVYAGPGQLAPEVTELLKDAQPTPETPLIEKASATKFCFKMIYAFLDGGGSDDFFTRVWPQLEQVEARYVAAAVARGGTLLWAGHLDSTGCTPLLTTPSATYQVAMYSQINRSGRMFQIRQSNADPTLTPMVQNVTIAAATASTVNVVMTAPLDVLNTMVVARRTVSAIPDALPVFTPSTMFPDHGEGQITININEGCGGTSTGCYAGNKKIKLGTDAEGLRLVARKFIIAHEIGHAVQDHLYGIFDNHNYATPEVAPEFCRCDHVEVHNDLHCLQSREHVSAAQGEGWAHFIAARIFNSADEANCGFQYYKEVITLFDGIDAPPALVGCHTPIRWRDAACSLADRGVEWDWLTFYWHLMTQTSDKFSWTDIRNLYRTACGGTQCDGADSPTWPALVIAANGLWGNNSAKRNYLVSLGASHGVD